METKFKKILISGIQLIGVCVFLLIAASSASTQKAGSSLDYRGAAVGGIAGSKGYIYIGKASSDREAQALVREKGYSSYVWDTINGNVYAK